jgi:hypothetical protein
MVVSLSAKSHFVLAESLFATTALFLKLKNVKGAFLSKFTLTMVEDSVAGCAGLSSSLLQATSIINAKQANARNLFFISIVLV